MVFYDQDLAGPDALYIGKSRHIRVRVFTDEDKSTRKNISGASATYVISARPGASAEITKTVAGGGIVISDPTNGLLTITLDSADTAALDDVFYHHDLTVSDADGNEAVVFEGEVEARRPSS